MISLESVDEPTEEVVEADVAPEPVPDVAPEAAPAPDVTEEPPGLVNDIEEVPAPKRRGRPPKAKAEAPEGCKSCSEDCCKSCP